MIHTLRSIAVAGTLAALAVGCGASGPILIETEGTVTGSDGKPLANVMVQFTPVDSGGAKVVSSTGVTDAAGKFVLKADTGRIGALAGTHKVTLVDNAVAEVPDEDLGKKRIKAVNRIDADYGSPTTTPLEVTVEAGKTHELKVERKK